MPPGGRLSTLVAKGVNQRCVLVIIADGFDEAETIVFLSLLRQAGLCVKSVGLTSGLVSSVHGVWLKPDLTLADLDGPTDTPSISAVILPEGRQSLARLEADPRVHRLLRRVVAQRGRIVTGHDGLQVARAAGVLLNEPRELDDDSMPVLLRKPEQSLGTFARDLIRRLKWSSRKLLEKQSGSVRQVK